MARLKNVVEPIPEIHDYHKSSLQRRPWLNITNFFYSAYAFLHIFPIMGWGALYCAI
jgi:hypothetical protein